MVLAIDPFVNMISNQISSKCNRIDVNIFIYHYCPLKRALYLAAN